jgi:hypothetical protein
MDLDHRQALSLRMEGNRTLVHCRSHYLTSTSRCFFTKEVAESHENLYEAFYCGHFSADVDIRDNIELFLYIIHRTEDPLPLGRLSRRSPGIALGDINVTFKKPMIMPPI